MSRVRTSIGSLLRFDREAGRAELVDAIELAGGNLRRTAHFVGVRRRWLYELIHRENLWPDVERARAAAASPDWLVRARRELRGMEDWIERCSQAYAGMTAQEIEEAILASPAAGYFQDVPLVAAYLASRGAAAP
jgi:hypothetical protein